MSSRFEIFQKEYDDFHRRFGKWMEEGTKVPRDMALLADIHMCANQLSNAAHSAVEFGLENAQANYVQIAMESLEQILGDSYKNYAPDSLFNNLEALRVNNNVQHSKHQKPTGGLDFKIDLEF